jgi:hypothetical protein
MVGGANDPDWVPPLGLIIGKGDGASKVRASGSYHHLHIICILGTCLGSNPLGPADWHLHAAAGPETGRDALLFQHLTERPQSD